MNQSTLTPGLPLTIDEKCQWQWRVYSSFSTCNLAIQRHHSR